LLHHIDAALLRQAYYWLKRDAAPGVDGMTWDAYGSDLDARLCDLETRVHRGSYRAQPSLRAYIPKPDGRQRPLGIAALEDKIVQRAMVEVLNAIYETDFLGFSYGFRPGRGQHDALDALAAGIENRAVNWILDADIKGFFDNIGHDWMMRFVEHRIGDRRVIRLIRKWLKAGVVEDGIRQPVTKGTPQGAVISPLLANIYLHYVYDLWADRWRNSTWNCTLIRRGWLNSADMPRPAVPVAGRASRKPSTSWALPISVRVRAGAAFCCPVIRGATGKWRSSWKSRRTSGDAGTRR